MDTYNISMAISYSHRLLEPKFLGVAALPLAGLLTAGCVLVSAPCEAAAGASKVLLHGPAATLHAELRLDDLGPVAAQYLAPIASADAAAAAADCSTTADVPAVAVAVAASQAAPPVCDNTAAAAGRQDATDADMTAAHSNRSTIEDCASDDDSGSNGSDSEADGTASQCSAGSGLVGQLWDAANPVQQAAALAAAPGVYPLVGEPDVLHSAGGNPAVAGASEPEQQWHATQPSSKHVPTKALQHQQQQQAAMFPVQQPAAAPQQAACHSCEARLRQHGSRKQEASRQKQMRAAAARRAEFLAAWQLAVWRSDQEKRFAAQLEVRYPVNGLLVTRFTAGLMRSKNNRAAVELVELAPSSAADIRLGMTAHSTAHHND